MKKTTTSSTSKLICNTKNLDLLSHHDVWTACSAGIYDFSVQLSDFLFIFHKMQQIELQNTVNKLQQQLQISTI